MIQFQHGQPLLTAGIAVMVAGTSSSEIITGRFDVTLGYQSAATEIELNLAGTDATPDFVFRFSESSVAQGAPPSVFWTLGTYDINNNDSRPNSLQSDGSTSASAPQDDTDFSYFKVGSGGSAGNASQHFQAGDVFDPSGTGQYRELSLYTDKDEDGGQGNFDIGLMGGSVDNEIRYFGFAFSDPFQPLSEGIDASLKVAGWVEVRFDVVDGPLSDSSLSRDDVEITLLRYAYSIIPGDPIVIGAVPCTGDLNNDNMYNVADVQTALNAVSNDDPSIDLAAPIGEFDVFDLLAFFRQADDTCE